MTFVTPWLLWGVLGVFVPVAIHRIMRPRRRPVRFPALRLLQSQIAAGQRAQRIRHWWVLLLRCGLVALLAVLLAGPFWPSMDSGVAANRARAALIVFDDSWSVGRSIDATDGAQAPPVEVALDWLGGAETWPEGSVVGLIFADPLKPDWPIGADATDLDAALRGALDGRRHDVALDDALRRAADQLDVARQPERRLLLVTDAAQHAFGDSAGGALGQVSDLSVTIATPREAAQGNLALLEARPTRHMTPRGAPIGVAVEVCAFGVQGAVTVVARLGGQVVARSKPIALVVDEERQTTLTIPPLESGRHVIEIAIEPEDRQDADQRRWVVVDVGPKPRVVLLVDKPALRGIDGDASLLILRNLLAPEALSDDAQRVQLTVSRPDNLPDLSGSGDDPAALVVVGPGVPLTLAQREQLRDYVQGGGRVLLAAAGSAAALPDWPLVRSWLASDLPRVEFLAEPMGLGWREPTNDVALDELRDAVVRRRVRLDALQPDVRVLAAFDDDVPALIARRMGRGEVLGLLTSADAGWSDLGIRPAALLTWLHTVLLDAPDRARAAVRYLSAGDVALGRVTTLPPGHYRIARLASGMVEEAGGADPDFEVTLAAGGGTGLTALAKPGVYRLTPEDGGGVQEALVLVVGWRAAESDPTRQTTADIAERLGVGAVESASGDDARESMGWASFWTDSLPPRAPLAGSLVLLMLLESRLSRHSRVRTPDVKA